MTPSEDLSRGRASSDTSSSLDPYYYGFTSSREGSPNPPPLPEPAVEVVRAHRHASSSRNRTSVLEPETPSRDPGNIDRNGLVGVGELTTPRWASDSSSMSFHQPRPSPSNAPIYEPYEKEDVTPSWGVSIFNDQKPLDDMNSPVSTYSLSKAALT